MSGSIASTARQIERQLDAIPVLGPFRPPQVRAFLWAMVVVLAIAVGVTVFG
jgi:hypothetical protein